MTVVKDFYKYEDKLVLTPTNSFIQIYFNQQVDYFNAFLLGPDYLNQSVIGYNGSQTGVLGIATTSASGWFGGDSNALVELSNGNFLMGFGDSFYGQLQNQGLYGGTTQPENLGFHNSFSYLITTDNGMSISANQFFIGANQNKVRSPQPPGDILTNDPKIIDAKPIIKSLCTSIVLGQTYNIDWAPQGRSSILTPDLSNQVNYDLLHQKATSGNSWPVADGSNALWNRYFVLDYL